MQDELRALRAELAGRPRPDATARPEPGDGEVPGDGSAVRPEWAAEMEAFRAALSDMTDTAEDLVADHPLVSVLSAFLLGVALGQGLERGRS
jgi:hypothetical protein